MNIYDAYSASMQMVTKFDGSLLSLENCLNGKINEPSRSEDRSAFSLVSIEQKKIQTISGNYRKLLFGLNDERNIMKI